MRPGPGQWSVAECAQHILETELFFFMPTVEKMLSEEPAPARMAEANGKDNSVIAGMENRGYKIKGQPWEESSEKVIDREALIASFQAKRAENIAWLENSDGAFRANFIDFPGMGTIDVYQFILFISAHTTRHTGQIHDIKELEFSQSA
jgi:23S rRNA G2069 N7-methylase RlmK/C1962 C5-methylase RlmI